jgi:hypothetical protein
VGGVTTPLLPICIENVKVQSYCARPDVPGASNRTPPVMCVVELTDDGAVPVDAEVNVSDPSMMIAGSPLIVTVCDWQPVKSILEDEVNVPPVNGVVALKVTDIDPPPWHGEVIVRERPSGETVIAAFKVAWFIAAATALCIPAVLTPGEDAAGEGADGPLPLQPARQPAAMINAPEVPKN